MQEPEEPDYDTIKKMWDEVDLPPFVRETRIGKTVAAS
jgi:hypothetical protein